MYQNHNLTPSEGFGFGIYLHAGVGIVTLPYPGGKLSLHILGRRNLRLCMATMLHGRILLFLLFLPCKTPNRGFEPVRIVPSVGGREGGADKKWHVPIEGSKNRLNITHNHSGV